ncbi:hypothetical protein C0Q70_03232 [Pomacea canaliculata]|uniref:Uncharacterized protein n=1 Tax=Pomacea canaliculata TaxID=400727 RepID=A0A2T7PS55_POMCA|nr:hypothetical protein C0Q70_03232 [Pomacea canaliculata]
MRVRSRLSCAVQRRTAHNGASSELLTPTMAGRVRTELTSCAVCQPVNRRLELVLRVCAHGWEILSHPILPTPPDLPSGDRNSTGAIDASQRVSKPEVCPIFSKCYLDQSCAPDYHENGRQPGARRSETMDRLVKHHVTRQDARYLVKVDTGGVREEQEGLLVVDTNTPFPAYQHSPLTSPAAARIASLGSPVSPSWQRPQGAGSLPLRSPKRTISFEFPSDLSPDQIAHIHRQVTQMASAAGTADSVKITEGMIPEVEDLPIIQLQAPPKAKVKRQLSIDSSPPQSFMCPATGAAARLTKGEAEVGTWQCTLHTFEVTAARRSNKDTSSSPQAGGRASTPRAGSRASTPKSAKRSKESDIVFVFPELHGNEDINDDDAAVDDICSVLPKEVVSENLTSPLSCTKFTHDDSYQSIRSSPAEQHYDVNGVSILQVESAQASLAVNSSFSDHGK